MAAAFFSPGYLTSRCSYSFFISTPTGGTWANLRCRKQKDFSKYYQCPTRRYLGTTVHKQYRKNSHKIYCMLSNHIYIRSGRTSLAHKVHSSAVDRSYVNVSAVFVDQVSQKSPNFNNQSLNFWDGALTSLAAVGIAIGLINYFSPEGQSLFRLEGYDGDDGCGNWFDVGDRGNSDGDDSGLLTVMGFISASPAQQEQQFYEHPIESDGKMTLHPPSLNVQDMSINSVSAETRPIELNESISRTKPYDISVRAIKGGRVTMEDEYFVADGGRFVAVFDGHGGGGVSQYLKNHLYDAVCNYVQIKHWEENDALLNRPSPTIRATACDRAYVRCPESLFDEIPSVFSFAAALKSAFCEMEHNVLKNDTLQFQGSTAVAVLIHEKYDRVSNSGTSKIKHRTLLSANIGDSRAILSRDGHAVGLTRDHKPNDDQEKARILAMGETIEWDRVSKVHRVRNLSLSRAIGDKYAKPVVSGEVEINHYPLMDHNDEFVMLASDGLWDVMTSEEAVAFVHEKIRKELSSKNVAKSDLANCNLVLRRNMSKFVAREAIRRGSSDNVCVVMVWLDEVG